MDVVVEELVHQRDDQVQQVCEKTCLTNLSSITTCNDNNLSPVRLSQNVTEPSGAIVITHV